MRRYRPRLSSRMRYCSTVLAAVCFHDHWSTTRARPAAPTVARRSSRPRAQRSLAASASLSPGGTTSAVSPSAPTTSGSAPTQVADGLVGLAARLALADDDQVGVVALGAQLGERLEQVAEALHRHVRAGGGDEPARDRGDMGKRAEQVDVDADRDDRHPVRVDLVVAGDVAEGVLG